MKMTNRIVAIALMLLAAPIGHAASEPALEDVVQLVETNLAGSEALDVDAVLETIHPESPGRAAVAQMARELAEYELQMEAADVEIVGTTGEYVLVRVLQHTTRVSGPAFMDNALDGIWALREHDGEWLYWSQMVLSITPLDSAAE